LFAKTGTSGFADLNLRYESDPLSQGNLEILQRNILGHEWRQCTEGILNPSMVQRDQQGGKNTLRRGKPVGESDTPILGELNQPKNSNIPRRITKSPPRGPRSSTWAVL
jgi:hypothetical protein